MTMTQLPNDGATPVSPERAAELAAQERCYPKDNPDNRQYRHSWQWVWWNGEMTTRIRCTVCGMERENRRN